jgi:2-C-methyl-D-erythritol 4-phosphate cytidylyltransferase
MTIWAIVPAAGVGLRMGSSTPKQYLPINGVPVIAVALQKLASIAEIKKIIVALHPQDELFSQLKPAPDKRVVTVVGGDDRQRSVLKALRRLKEEEEVEARDWVLVHDAARPCVLSSDIRRLLAQLQDHDVGGLLGAPAENTLKQVDDQELVQNTIDRTGVWNAFTPQMFRYGLLLAALEAAVENNAVTTDEASAVELMGYRPQMIEGASTNIKITHAADLELATKILELQE